MLFNSGAFAVFLPVMLLAYWRLHGAARRWALLIGSLFFYSWWDWRFTSLLLLTVAVDYACGLAIAATENVRRRRWILTVSVVSNLGVLAGFKYFNFFRDSAAAVLSALGLAHDLPMLHVILPMGISFYTFQSMSYTIDVYRGMPAERSLRDFALFVTCFPQLVAGPIVRASDLLPQLKVDQRFERVDLPLGAYRLFRGLFKKMVVADVLSMYVDRVFADPSAHTGLSAWIALYAYAFQIYMDFSGYTDVAIGTGELLGLRFCENFDRPYLAATPSEFWRRWHVSLSTWLRDYLYVPLGGSWGSTGRTLRNLMLTMGLGGLWHGAAWTFVAWGLYHGTLLSVERVIFGGGVAAGGSRFRGVARIVGMVATFHLICLGWLLFRAPDWATVGTMLASLTDFSPAPVHGKRIALLLAACLAAHAWPEVRSALGWFRRVHATAQGILAGAAMWVLLLCSPAAKPFIYFQF
ncbi:MAG: MBOAT family protein [Planctomycetota bacterium]